MKGGIAWRLDLMALLTTAQSQAYQNDAQQTMLAGSGTVAGGGFVIVTALIFFLPGSIGITLHCSSAARRRAVFVDKILRVADEVVFHIPG